MKNVAEKNEEKKRESCPELPMKKKERKKIWK
jgi:hypothetical protein